ncbi:MAG: hypothetical protein F4Y03_18290 [Alphaproteobacteria bacterium]|nr:hypothetical protein [Alphaproteobacteria bacterium]
MKLAIPLSGGLDSAVLLSETLRDTDHDVAVIHVAERDIHGRGVAGWERNVEAMRKVVEWCGREIRPVAAVLEAPLVDRMGHGGPIPDDLEIAYRHPDSPHTHRMYTNCTVHASIGAAVERLRPDEVWMGMHSWNFRGGGGTVAAALEAQIGYSNTPIRHPFLTHDLTPGKWWGPGRMAQYRRLPEALVPFVFGCRSPQDGARCGRCDACATEPFYRTFCAGASDAELARIEDLIEREAMMGRWYRLADPQTFRRHDIFDLLRDRDYWRRLLASRTETERETLRAAKKIEIDTFNAPRKTDGTAGALPYAPVWRPDRGGGRLDRAAQGRHPRLA